MNDDGDSQTMRTIMMMMMHSGQRGHDHQKNFVSSHHDRHGNDTGDKYDDIDDSVTTSSSSLMR